MATRKWVAAAVLLWAVSACDPATEQEPNVSSAQAAIYFGGLYSGSTTTWSPGSCYTVPGGQAVSVKAWEHEPYRCSWVMSGAQKRLDAAKTKAETACSGVGGTVKWLGPTATPAGTCGGYWIFGTAITTFYVRTHSITENGECKCPPRPPVAVPKPVDATAAPIGDEEPNPDGELDFDIDSDMELEDQSSVTPGTSSSANECWNEATQQLSACEQHDSENAPLATPAGPTPTPSLQ